MRAALLYGAGDLRLESIRMPEPGSGEVRIRIGAALTCGTDVKVYRRGYHARMIRLPAVFGHELAGTIEAVGSGVDNWRVGQRVVAANSAPCGACAPCRQGREDLCRDLQFLNGAYAEAVVAPARIVERNLLEAPAGLPLEQAAMVEPLACALNGLASCLRARGAGGDASSLLQNPADLLAEAPLAGVRSLIIGAGPLGLFFSRLLSAAGSPPLVLGRRLPRLEAARALGAAAALEEGSLEAEAALGEVGDGLDLVIEAVGSAAAWEQAMRLTRPGGVACLFGGCPGGTRVPLDADRLHYEALTLTGSFHHTPAAVRAALSLLSSRLVDVSILVGRRASLEELPGVMAGLASGEIEGPKVAIIP